jgi:hypothetical protein
MIIVAALALQPQFAAAGRLSREAVLHTSTSESTTLSYSPSWMFDDPDQIGALLGIAVAVVGDINNDGYDDVMVGAERYCLTVDSEGAAFLFYGSAAGLAFTPAWSGGGNAQGSRYGGAVAGAGDVNGDGYDDFIVGARRLKVSYSEEGAAYVFHGSPSGPGDYPTWSQFGNQKSALFGSAVASAGDVNADGYADVLVGAPLMESDPIKNGEGMAFMYLGSPGGLSGSPAWSRGGGSPGMQFGAALAHAGDVNGDGYDDVLIGAPNPVQQGQAFVFFGGEDGLASDPAWTATDQQTQGNFGYAVAGAGDLNQDGYGDIAIGAPTARIGDVEIGGVVYVYFGSPTGLGNEPEWVITINQIGARFGTALSPAGDVTGDGLDDFLVGAPYYKFSKPTEGGVFLFPGKPTGSAAPRPAWQVYGGKADALLGSALSGAGDFNQDDRFDLVAGAPEYNIGTVIVGRSFGYYGQEGLLLPDQLFIPILYKTP